MKYEVVVANQFFRTQLFRQSPRHDVMYKLVVMEWEMHGLEGYI